MSSPDLMLVCCGGLGLRLVASGREVVLRLPMSAREMGWRVPTCGNYPPPPPTLSKQHLCPSNTRRWFCQFFTVDFGGAFFNLFHCVPCALPDTLVLRYMMFIFCVKVALLAKRAFVACSASWCIVIVIAYHCLG